MKTSLTNQPYFFLWFVIPAMLGMSLLQPDSTIAFQLHDTYFVIAFVQVGLFFAALLGIEGLLYWLMKNRPLTKWITIFHAVFTVLFALYFLFLATKPIAEGDSMNIILHSDHSWLLVAIFIFVMSQFLFLINIAMSFLKQD